MTRLSAVASGTTDPVTYAYDATHGAISAVAYTNGGSTTTAKYQYDTAGQLTKLLDWRHASSGIVFAYDSAGRLTKETDEVRASRHIDYTYDAGGRVITMNDWAGQDTVYTYTAVGAVSTVTGPGVECARGTVHALRSYLTPLGTVPPLGQPTKMSLPNGMEEAYLYDAENRLTKKTLKTASGGATAEEVALQYNTAGQISQKQDADGHYWNYAYDARYRLTQAQWNEEGDAYTRTYDYAYDDADNLISKTEPFIDDFDDGNLTGWTVGWGSLSASNGYVENTSTATTHGLISGI